MLGDPETTSIKEESPKSLRSRDQKAKQKNEQKIAESLNCMEITPEKKAYNLGMQLLRKMSQDKKKRIKATRAGKFIKEIEELQLQLERLEDELL